MPRRFTLYILVGMALGLVAGWICHTTIRDPAAAKGAAGYFSLLTDVFLRLIRMIIAPLVLSTLIGGIAHMGDAASVGRVGLKTISWFLAASLGSLIIGMTIASLLNLGGGLHLGAGAAAATGVQSALSLKDFLEHVFPASVVDSMAKNEILQIVVFSVFVGVAMGALGERAHGLLVLVEQLGQVMLKVTTYVMLTAPVAVFGAIAATVTTQGLGILATYAAFVGWFYFAMAVLWALILFAGFLAMGPRVIGLFRSLREPLLIAFSTATSEAAYPQTLERLEAFGVSKRVASFVLPLGYSFNLDGSMIYCTFATLFIAQAYDIHLTLGQKITMLLILMVTSKGIAGVPRASLVVIAATLAYFKIPEAGLVLILPVDHFLDMGRSATNVLGNSVAAGAVARWEGELRGA
jgi:Na+/H+-dicarboxylate symporter